MKNLVKKIVLLVIFGVVFAISGYSQNRVYSSDRENLSLEEINNTIVKETLDIDDRYTIKCEYRPYLDEMIMTVSGSPKIWDDDDVEFVIYCAIMHFIEDQNHRYYHYITKSRKITYRNVNTITIKYILQY